ncbi:MAG TPA: EamA family transporter [Alphaproteobacteria bacterium]|nr:EamA family transporter [Alphaproteobacteria bacterium]
MKTEDVLLTVMVMVLWGLNFVVAKIGLEELPPMLLVGIRFLLVALLLIGLVPIPRGHIGKIVALSISMGALHFGLMFMGIRNVDAAIASVAIQLQVPFAALLAWIFLGDRLGWRRVGGMALAFLGIVVIAGEPRMLSNLTPLALIVAASFLWAVGNVQLRDLRAVGPMALNAWLALFAAPQMLIASAVFEDGQWQALANAGWKGWGAIVYMIVFVTIIVYGFWYRMAQRYPVNLTMAHTLQVPVWGVLASVGLLGERLTWAMVAGSLLTLAGVAVIVLWRPAPVPVPQRPES